MIEHSGRAILLDIEGTTSSVSFVYDVMFPFARRELDRYLDDHWGDGEIAPVCELFSIDPGDKKGKSQLRAEALRLMDADSKTTGLKKLQGLIWRSGFESGELKAHVYDEVPDILHAWKESGHEIRIYSSGSIAAQKLFFAHTIFGDLLNCFQGHYDTTIGSKREEASYAALAADWKVEPHEILFISDIVAELDAAQSAGLATILCLRPTDTPPETQQRHAEITNFRQVQLAANLGK